MATALQDVLNQVCGAIDPASGTGQVATYIPALAQVDPHKFGVAITLMNGESAHFGDADEAFSIQSISKVLTLTQALERHGATLWESIRPEPSGSAFNSITQLEREDGIPRNPLINAGALVVSDQLLVDSTPEQCLQELMDFIHGITGDSSIQVNKEVAASELATANRNASLAHFMKSFGNLKHEVEDVLNLYCHHCSIDMSCQQLSRAFLYLANSGVDPITNLRVVADDRARRINAIMMLCGHYDGAGEFAFRVGLPGKSGVGGGIVTIIPQRGVIAVWSPRLNAKGSSTLGTQALEALVTALELHIL